MKPGFIRLKSAVAAPVIIPDAEVNVAGDKADMGPVPLQFFSDPINPSDFTDTDGADRQRNPEYYFSQPGLFDLPNRKDNTNAPLKPRVLTLEQANRLNQNLPYDLAVLKQLKLASFTALAHAAPDSSPDIKMSISDKLSAFLQDPVTIGTIYAISTSASIPDAIREDVIMMYTTLAHGESGFDSGVWSKAKNPDGSRVSARGQLQIMNATYAGALGLVKEKANHHPSLARSIITSFYNALAQITRDPWAPKNRANSRFDATQYEANLGLMLAHLDTIKRNWYWNGSSWQSLNPDWQNPRTLKNRFGVYLGDQRLGRQLLFSYYHINGSGIDKSSNKLSHTDRLTADPKYFQYLTAIPNYAPGAANVAKQAIAKYAHDSGNPSVIGGRGFEQTVLSRLKETGDVLPNYDRQRLLSRLYYRQRRRQRFAPLAFRASSRFIPAQYASNVFAPVDSTLLRSGNRGDYGWANFVELVDTTDGDTFGFYGLERLVPLPKDKQLRKGVMLGKTGHHAGSFGYFLAYKPKGGQWTDPATDPKKRFSFTL